MNIRPKRHGFGEDGKTIMHYGDFLVVECEVYSPPSAVGRTVYVFLDDDDVTDLLRECRDAATRHRRPDHKPVRWAELGMKRRNGLADLADWINEHAADD